MESYFGLTLPIWGIVLAVCLAYSPRFAVVVHLKRRSLKYDNNHPRALMASLDGLGARAQAAHMNSLEGFPIYAVAVLVAERHVADGGAAASTVAALALAYPLLRVIYIALYLSDVATARSLVWFLGMVVCAALFFV
jgi:uncharacterized MAPEG superfamily protein